MIELIDSHCHLDDDRFDDQLPDVLQRANADGINHFIVPATTRQRWPLLQKLNETYHGIHVAYGFHPQFMEQHTAHCVDELESFIDNNKAVAVGECGLDFFHSKVGEKQQKKLFEAQLDVAKNLDFPCIIHSRKSLDDVLSILRKKRIVGGVLHSFSGSLQQAQQLIDLGFKLGIAATVCFDRAKKLQSIVRQVSLESLLLESDAPDQSGPDYRGQVNQPVFMLKQCQKIAELKDLSVSEVAQQTYCNTTQLFKFNK